MSGNDLFEKVCHAEDIEAELNGLTDAELRELGDYVAPAEGGVRGMVAGLVTVESSRRWMGRRGL